MAMCSKCGSMNGDDVVKCPWCAFSKNYADENARLRAEVERMAQAQIDRTERANVMWTREHDRADKAEAALAVIYEQAKASLTDRMACGTLYSSYLIDVIDEARALRNAKGEG